MKTAAALFLCATLAVPASANDTASQFENPSPIDFTRPFLYDGVTPKPGVETMPKTQIQIRPLDGQHIKAEDIGVEIVDPETGAWRDSEAIREFLDRLDARAKARNDSSTGREP